MSNSNYDNRQNIQSRVGAIAATKTFIIFVALQKCRVHKALVTDQAAQAASGSNYLGHQLEAAAAAVGSEVEADAGLAALESLALELGTTGYIELEAGEALELVTTKNGTGAGTDVVVSLDVETIGNSVIA